VIWLAVPGCWIKGNAIGIAQGGGESGKDVCLRTDVFGAYVTVKAILQPKLPLVWIMGHEKHIVVPVELWAVGDKQSLV